MARTKLVGGLISWLTGGLSARLDFIERDLDTLQGRTQRLSKEQDTLARVVGEHHQELAAQRRQLDAQATEMIALRKMHALLSAKVGQAFPGKPCPGCGSKMIFRRQAAEKAYSLECETGCGKRLLLAETQLLSSFTSDG